VGRRQRPSQRSRTGKFRDKSENRRQGEWCQFQKSGLDGTTRGKESKSAQSHLKKTKDGNRCRLVPRFEHNFDIIDCNQRPRLQKGVTREHRGHVRNWTQKTKCKVEGLWDQVHAREKHDRKERTQTHQVIAVAIGATVRAREQK